MIINVISIEPQILNNTHCCVKVLYYQIHIKKSDEIINSFYKDDLYLIYCNQKKDWYFVMFFFYIVAESVLQTAWGNKKPQGADFFKRSPH